MHLDQLKAELTAILSLEELPDPDWLGIEARCLDLGKRLIAEGRRTHPAVVSHFVDDPDIRKKDRLYAERQRTLLREWLRA